MTDPDIDAKAKDIVDGLCTPVSRSAGGAAKPVVTDEMLTAAMRAFELMSSVLRYREKDKWHSCDMMGMRDAIKAAIASSPTPQIAEGVRETRETGFVKPDNARQVFFYEQDFYVLSNFSAFQVRSYGIDFATSEHLYHWEKFNGEASHQFEIQRKILFSHSAHDAFKIAEKYRASRRTNWDDVKVNVMRSILRAKVEQHEYVRRKLLATGDRELIEDSWRDDFWGWGPNRDGQNMLGKLWTEIRSELRTAALSPQAQAGERCPVCSGAFPCKCVSFDEQTKSAPVVPAPHNSGERLPSGDTAGAGADTLVTPSTPA